MPIRSGLVGLIAAIQSIVLRAHVFQYETWTCSAARADRGGPLWLKLACAALSVSFLSASLLAFRYTSATLRAFYRAAAVWLGLLSFLFLAAVASWIVFGVAWLAGLDVNFH